MRITTNTITYIKYSFSGLVISALLMLGIVYFYVTEFSTVSGDLALNAGFKRFAVINGVSLYISLMLVMLLAVNTLVLLLRRKLENYKWVIGFEVGVYLLLMVNTAFGVALSTLLWGVHAVFDFPKEYLVIKLVFLTLFALVAKYCYKRTSKRIVIAFHAYLVLFIPYVFFSIFSLDSV